MNIIADRAVLHIIDPNGMMPIISQTQLDISAEEVFDFIYNHSVKVWEDPGIKEAVFNEYAFRDIISDINQDNFLEKSCIIAQNLYNILYQQPTIPKGDLLVCCALCKSRMFLFYAC